MLVRAKKPAQYNGFRAKGSEFDHPRGHLFPDTYEIIDPNWQPEEVKEAEEVKEVAAPKPDLDIIGKEQAIQKAVYSLDPNDDELWSSQGLPKTDAIENITGFEVKRADIREAVGEFSRSEARAKA